MDHPRAWLRYVDADDLDDSAVRFDGLDVVGRDAAKLGNVDGFIIDISSARPYYVVVDAGGWFTSKFFLLPVGHVGFDKGARKLIADIDRDRVKHYPGFNRDEFKELSEDELNRMDERMVAVCCPDELVGTPSSQRLESRRHYGQPSWWDASYYRPDRIDETTVAGRANAPSRDEVREERDRAIAGEQVIARDRVDTGDVSPHFGGRAQPGDVLGVETGGERTYVGDTSEEENKRRRDAENAAAKKR